MAFKTSRSNQGLVLDFTLDFKVLISPTNSTTDENFLKSSGRYHSHISDLSSQEILLTLIVPQKFHMSHFSLSGHPPLCAFTNFEYDTEFFSKILTPNIDLHHV